MTRSRLIGFLGFLFVLEVLHAAGPRITVDESRIRVEFGDTATLTLPVTNSTTQPITTTLHLAFLDKDSKALQELAVPVVIHEGRTILEADVSGFLQLEQASKPNYGWLRLKYSMPGDAEGIVSLSKIAPEPFILDVISPRNPVLSAPYRVQVLARDPVLGKPVANVGIRGTVASDEEPTEKNLKSARTNASGYAELNFDLSRFPSGSDLEIEVRGNLRKFVRTVSDTSTIDRDFFAVTSMDKPIYQPGEKLRIRTLAFDRMHNALKGTQVQVTIEDPDDDTVFQTSLMTSPYGEAHTEWSIPENARIGNYEIRVGSEGRTSSIDRVWIGRYDLPSVSIDVRQKRPYYVPGETAEVEIRADYLFGKPVPFAAVKVVRQLDRTWNYREMKWDIEEGEVIVGTTDRDGFFETRLSIDDDLAKLSDRRVFADVPYAVFVTDPSTGRTEQRRFWTRVTLFPIHLYIVEAFPGSLPREFYVAASYADGRAAECDVEIFEILDGDRLKREVVRTNSYGVARVRGLWPSASRGSNDELREMQFVASDAAGNAGQTLDYFRTERHTLRLYTDKTLYRQSDPIAVHVESTVPSGQIVVNASIDGRVLHSAAVQLSAGKADVVIPFSSDFRGSVFISAYHSAFTNSLFEGPPVSFPSTGGLEIESSFDKTTYAPGEQATLKLQLRNGNRSSQEGIFGVTVFDKAVEERARADAEF